MTINSIFNIGREFSVLNRLWILLSAFFQPSVVSANPKSDICTRSNVPRISSGNACVTSCLKVLIPLDLSCSSDGNLSREMSQATITTDPGLSP